MSKTRTYHQDICPYTNTMHDIEVEYFQVPILGQTEYGYKLAGYSCSFEDEYPYPSQDKYGRCPVYLSAPDKPY